jgi:15-cis-phytoene desaturase
MKPTTISVSIFGAGVAGMTAAHELSQRGFKVQLCEVVGDERNPEAGCDVGGMARTHWGALASSTAASPAESSLSWLKRRARPLSSTRLRDVHWLPGEHGYRFFPSFYRHLFDTMKRIPLSGVQGELGRTVFDNLKPTTGHILSLDGGAHPIEFSRSAPTSITELWEFLGTLFGSGDQGGLDLDPRDAARITMRILQFATSSSERRVSYERMSWFEFLGAKDFLSKTQRLLEKWPRALVAMSASECDARTQGVPMLQLFLDQLRPTGYRDGTLNAPTSEAWFTPWRACLEKAGVEFVRGRLTGFEQVTVDDGSAALKPIVEGLGANAKSAQFLKLPDYIVVALPALEARRLARDPRNPLAKTEDWARLAAMDDAEFKRFAGIQFYFDEDVLWFDGHAYHPSSAWGLTSISQARFWTQQAKSSAIWRGVVSVIIGDWDTEDADMTAPKRARDCQPQELAERVWHQLEASMGMRQRRRSSVGRYAKRTPDSRIPLPVAWQLDHSLGHGAPPSREAMLDDASLMFIARPGAFERRPGSPESYAVHRGVVLTGQYTQTYTRLPCMEAANESARHAVNAIISDVQSKRTDAFYRSPGSYCDVWNPEDREVDDLRFLKDLDRVLCERGVPHLFDVLGADELVGNVLRGGARDPFDPLSLLTRLRRLLDAGDQA